MLAAAFTVRMTEKYGVFIDCDDWETGDEFDDYLHEVLDLEVGYMSTGPKWTFIMGESMTIDQAEKIVADFKLLPPP